MHRGPPAVWWFPAAVSYSGGTCLGCPEASTTNYTFSAQGCHYTEPMSGLILKYATEGQLNLTG